MKKFKGFSTGAVVGAIVAILVVVAGILVVDRSNKAVNFDKYNFAKIIAANEDNGNIGDHVKGNPDARAVIVEYADFQCEFCALMNSRVNALVKELGDDVAVVYRNFLLSYHKNGTAAASAAEAAGLQGYWKEYADKLFSNQPEWYSADASERTALFNKYFNEVTKGEGDLDKFNKDISSERVRKKLDFDAGIGERVEISGTPSFYIDGQKFDYGNKEGSKIIIDGKTFVWDSQLTGDGFEKYIKEIVKVKNEG